MAHWHATATGDLRTTGTAVIIRSVHGSLRVLAADQLTIEDGLGQRASAVVVDRNQGELMLGITDGTMLRLTLESELSLPKTQSTDSFSEQSWLVVSASLDTSEDLPGETPRKEPDHATSDERRA